MKKILGFPARVGQFVAQNGIHNSCIENVLLCARKRLFFTPCANITTTIQSSEVWSVSSVTVDKWNTLQILNYLSCFINISYFSLTVRNTQFLPLNHLDKGHCLLEYPKYFKKDSTYIFPFYPNNVCFIKIGTMVMVRTSSSNNWKWDSYLLNICFTDIGLPKYYAQLQTAVTRGLGWPAGRLAGRHTDAAPKLSLLFHFSFRVDGHVHRRTFAKQRC